MISQFRRQLVVVLGLCAFAACASPNSTAAQGDDLVGGKAEDGYTSVGYFMFADGIGKPKASHYVFCTGTLIAPDVVLTAAHCLDDAAHAVVFGVGRVDENRHYRIKQKLQHPSYQMTPDVVANDVAIVRLESPVKGTSVARLSAAKEGSSYRSVGYGQTVADVQTFKDPDKGMRKSAMFKVSDVDGTVVKAASKTAANCYGDSGGPLMVDGEDSVVAVFSSRDKEACNTGDVSTYMHVDAYRGFIKKALSASSSEDLLDAPPVATWQIALPTRASALHVDLRNGNVVLARTASSGGSRRTIASYSGAGKLRWEHESEVAGQFELHGISKEGVAIANLRQQSHVGLRDDGAALWTREGAHRFTSGRLFDLETSGNFAEIDPATGKERWRQSVDAKLPSGLGKGSLLPYDAVAGSKGHSYFIGVDGTGISGAAVGYGASGEFTRSFKIEQIGVGAVADDGSLLIHSVDYLRRYDSAGNKAWEIPLTGERVASHLQLDPTGSTVFLVDDPTYGASNEFGKGALEAYDIKTGRLRWKKYWGAIKLAFGTNGKIFALSRVLGTPSEAKLLGLESDGTVLWMAKETVDRSSTIATDASGALYASGSDFVVKYAVP